LSLFTELKRRNVFRIGIAYGITAWLIAQLEGSVRKFGNRLRITAQLIKTNDGFQLWSQTYDRTLDDIFVTQDEIATAVVDALKITLLGAIPAPRVKGFALAREAVDKALTIDGNYAEARKAMPKSSQ